MQEYNEKKKILVVFGTRPEAIKMGPVVTELRERGGLEARVCVTGQHRELLRGPLELFGITPDYDLHVMREGQDLYHVTAAVLEGIRGVLEAERPWAVLVHGDTTTAFAAALACFYSRVPVFHVEAGLRTYDLSAPFPEEWNRRAVSLLSAHHFAPTERARKNLLDEGIPEERITVTGNTGIDALRTTVREDYTHPELSRGTESRLLLLTVHRRENRGEPMRRILRAVRRVVEEFPDVRVIYPVHPEPLVRQTAETVFAGCERVRLIPPMDTMDFHNFLGRCHLVITDSGGIQEEAPALGKPVLVTRNSTERPEGLEAGCMRLIGSGEGAVYRGIRELLENEALYAVMSAAPCPYGDGHASRRIADRLEKILL